VDGLDELRIDGVVPVCVGKGQYVLVGGCVLVESVIRRLGRLLLFLHCAYDSTGKIPLYEGPSGRACGLSVLTLALDPCRIVRN